MHDEERTRHRSSRLIWVPLILVVPILGARPIGMSHAYLDHLLGYEAIKLYGLWRPVQDDYAHLLLTRYDVHVNRVAGCVVWGPEVWYANGYNRISRALINRRYSKDVFEECFTDAAREKHRARTGEPT